MTLKFQGDLLSRSPTDSGQPSHEVRPLYTRALGRLSTAETDPLKRAMPASMMFRSETKLVLEADMIVVVGIC